MSEPHLQDPDPDAKTARIGADPQLSQAVPQAPDPVHQRADAPADGSEVETNGNEVEAKQLEEKIDASSAEVQKGTPMESQAPKEVAQVAEPEVASEGNREAPVNVNAVPASGHDATQIETPTVAMTEDPEEEAPVHETPDENTEVTEAAGTTKKTKDKKDKDGKKKDKKDKKEKENAKDKPEDKDKAKGSKSKAAEKRKAAASGSQDLGAMFKKAK